MVASEAKAIVAYRIEDGELVPMDETAFEADVQEALDAVERGETVSEEEADRYIDALIVRLRTR